MKYTIAFSAYDLIPNQPIQSKIAHSIRCGALLKFHFENGTIGYADCHPWVELGDDPLKTQLKMLKEGVCTKLTAQSLAFAWCDAEARSAGINLFADKIIPPSHYLLANLENYHLAQVLKHVEEGFTRIKIKLGNHLKEEVKNLKKLCEILFENEALAKKLLLRLDFNLKLDFLKFEQFLEEIGLWKEKIEFYEDPFGFDFDVWRSLQKKHRINLACDYLSERVCQGLDCSIIAIHKPAVQAQTLFQAGYKRIVTSYLDHPLGQLCAAFTASSVQNNPIPLEICGLLSHKIYQNNAFSEQLFNDGPVLVPPGGTGFGFNELLESQTWCPLK